MTVNTLLDRLHGVRQTGGGRWLACCSSHDDHRASLSVRELDDGRVLLHCFAGCSAADVLAAVGLTFETLFPERALDHRVKRERRPFNAHDVLKTLVTEIAIIIVYVADLRAGHVPSHRDHERFLIACGRITQAKESANA